MRDRIRIRRTAPQEWTVTIPTIGFGPPEVWAFPVWADAMRYADATWRDRARNTGSTVIELERPGAATDRLNPISPWTPLWIPGT